MLKDSCEFADTAQTSPDHLNQRVVAQVLSLINLQLVICEDLRRWAGFVGLSSTVTSLIGSNHPLAWLKAKWQRNTSLDYRRAGYSKASPSKKLSHEALAKQKLNWCLSRVIFQVTSLHPSLFFTILALFDNSIPGHTPKSSGSSWFIMFPVHRPCWPWNVWNWLQDGLDRQASFNGSESGPRRQSAVVEVVLLIVLYIYIYTSFSNAVWCFIMFTDVYVWYHADPAYPLTYINPWVRLAFFWLSKTINPKTLKR